MEPPVTAATGRLRALTHPLRLEILEHLATDGPLTATQLSRRVAASPANCSWHLRHLAAAGYIEEDEQRGRNRPWRLKATELAVTSDDGEVGLALQRLILDRQVARLFHTRPEDRDDSRQKWSMRVWLTDAELQTYLERLSDLLAFLDRFTERTRTDKPRDAQLYETVMWLAPFETES